jgi:ADP-ribose pyrophosphatase YjhB (NUDIX family)
VTHLLKRLYFYLSWPGLALYFAAGKRSRVVIFDTAGRVLLVQGKWQAWYDDDGGLSLPGGGLQAHESPKHGASRELAEELGVAVPEAELEFVAETRIAEYGIGYGAYIFKTTLRKDVELTLQSSEIVTAKWYSLQDLRHVRLKPDVRRALELLASAG